MTETELSTALGLLKQRMNRMQEDTSLDGYFSFRLQAVWAELTGTNGIALDLSDPADLLLLVDATAWQYQNRDNPGSMPEWLRLRRRERWLREAARGVTP